MSEHSKVYLVRIPAACINHEFCRHYSLTVKELIQCQLGLLFSPSKQTVRRSGWFVRLLRTMLQRLEKDHVITITLGD